MMITNGSIYTLEAENEVVDTICVNDGIIIYVGCAKNAKERFNARTIVDLKGKTMLPGLGDSHLHFYAYCQNKTNLNLGTCTSKSEMIEVISQKAEDTPQGKWIRGVNFDESKWGDDKSLPTKADLDSVSDKHPIMIKRVCLHTAVANSFALKLANVTKGATFGQGGIIDLDSDGEPTGIFREQASMIFDELIPDPLEDKETRYKIMKEALEEASSLGLTTIHTFAADIWKYIERPEDYVYLDRKKMLPMRVYIYLDTNFCKPYLTYREMYDPFNKVKYGGYKIFSDGSIGSRSAKLFEPYSDDKSTSGFFVQTTEALNLKVYNAFLNGLQPTIHAIGDKALDSVLDAITYTIEKVKKGGMTQREIENRDPFRIVHAQMATDDMICRMQKLPIVLDIQPIFLETDMLWIKQRIGENRAKYSYRWKTYLDAGLVLTGGSDCPVESFNPWENIYVAVARKNLNKLPHDGFQPEEKLSIYEAITLFTKNLHYATGQDKFLGTIKKGKFADLIVIDRNIFEIDEDEILNIKVEQTYLAGELVYERSNEDENRFF